MRHGSRPDGEIDPGLDANGVESSKEFAAKLKLSAGERHGFAPLQSIFCSPFCRALETAGPIAEALNLPVCMEWGFCDILGKNWIYQVDPLPSLRNRNVESLPYHELIDPAYATAVTPNFPDCVGRLLQGDMLTRAKPLERHQIAVKAALKYADGGSVLVVGHGSTHDFVAEALCGAEQHDKEKHTPFCVPHCSVTEILEVGENCWSLEQFGTLGHLWHQYLNRLLAMPRLRELDLRQQRLREAICEAEVAAAR